MKNCKHCGALFTGIRIRRNEMMKIDVELKEIIQKLNKSELKSYLIAAETRNKDITIIYERMKKEQKELESENNKLKSMNRNLTAKNQNISTALIRYAERWGSFN